MSANKNDYQNKLLLALAILSILSTTLTGYALAAGNDTNTSINRTTVDPVVTPLDTIVINENTKVINITENSNETIVAETIIKEEQTKSSQGFWLTATVISLIAAIFIIMVIVYIKKNR